MEHLPLREDSKRIIIPYVCVEEFDGGEFLSYPQRKGWDIPRWRRGMLPRRYDTDFDRDVDVDEVAAFLQTWLFFGLLSSCLQSKIVVSDFVRTDARGQAVITTANLQRYLESWKLRAADETETEREEKYASVLRFTDEALIVVDNFQTFANYARTQGRDEYEKVQEQVFAIYILDSAITSANRKIYRPGIWFGTIERSPNAGHMASLLEERLQQDNWCSHTIRTLKGHFDADLQAYAYAVGTVRSRQDHSNCTPSRCISNGVGARYTVKHRQESCHCDFEVPAIEAIVSILKSGRIPVMTIVESPDQIGGLQYIVEPSTPGLDYLAISHVWADGLGNPDGNVLPACQLAYIYSAIKKALDTETHVMQKYPEYLQQTKRNQYGTVAIWFDTLCIPVGQEHQGLRDFSINEMNRIYKDASGVLVFDPDLQALHPEATKPEWMTRLLLSGWCGRLWTFQEGTVGASTYLVGAESAWDVQEMYLDRLGAPWPPPEPLQYVLEAALYTRFNRKIRLYPAHMRRWPEWAMQRMIAGISDRSTSRENDEAVVIGTFAGIDILPILSVSTPDERMVVLMRSLPSVPANILFAWGPRCEVGIEKYGNSHAWVPRTLLAPFGVDELLIPREVPLDASRPDQLSPRPLSYIHLAPEHGLAAFFPGIRIFRPTKRTETPFTVLTSSGSRYVVLDAAYGPSRPWWLDEPSEAPADSALVLSEFDHHIHNSPTLLTRITRESTMSSDSERDFLRVQSRRMMRITRRDEYFKVETYVPEAEEHIVQGEYFAPRWWLIDPN